MTWAGLPPLNLPNLQLFWAIEIDFVEPLTPSLRWTTREARTISGVAFEVAPIEMEDLSRLTRLEEMVIFNDQGQYTAAFYDANTTGARVRIWQGHGTGSVWVFPELRQIFHGTMGRIGLGPSIRIRLKAESYRQTPSLVLADVIPAEFRIPDGAVAITPDGNVQFTLSSTE